MNSEFIELDRFLSDFWSQDGDVVFGDVTGAASAFKQVSGIESYSNLISQIILLYNRNLLPNYFGEDIKYETLLGKEYHSLLTRYQAEKLMEQYYEKCDGEP